ncbi:adhesin-like autotransporter domain protein [Escherichia coli 2-210-07_S4_C2]|nr:adhesin-like autotransporter domain protein [Escherichia coli 2-156-04_S4_C3]KDX54017.1 adhesin-like autotransporter domain protein [Escherichia coli 2-210-07_S4_C2]KDX59969.1 adhesin-like autotransporter domain protein [Escherichia coli 2-210-07_S4_C3]KEM89288.1 putative iS1 protein [Escherichia coli 2-222-05_S4_C1]
MLDVSGGTATNVTQHDGAILKTNTNGTTVSGTNSEGAFSIHNHVADNVLLENGGHLDINAYGSANKTIIKDKGTMSVLTNAKADATRIDNGGGGCCQLTDLVYDGVFEVLQWLLFLSAVPPVQLLTGWCVTAKAPPDISAISALTAVKHGNCSSLTPLLNPVRTRKSLIWP